jgi:shikimate dehydrogenase
MERDTLKEERMIDLNTRLIGLLGYPLKHSFSPRMHNYAYLKNDLNYAYIPIEIKAQKIDDAIRGMKVMNFVGFNVTIPYKIKIMDYLDEIDELAEKIGSVNTVSISAGKLKGYNTDGLGFIKSLEENKINYKDITVLVVGAGGASRSISMTLAENGVEDLYIANRTYDKAKNLSEEINTKIKNCSQSLHLNKIEDQIKKIDLIINTTSIGMSPDIDKIPLNTELLNKNTTVVDIIYNPVKTKLLKEAEKKGCKILNGIEMLVNQGAEAFEIWTGKKAPAVDMKKELEEFLL